MRWTVKINVSRGARIRKSGNRTHRNVIKRSPEHDRKGKDMDHGARASIANTSKVKSKKYYLVIKDGYTFSVIA